MSNLELLTNETKNVGSRERYASSVLGSLLGAFALNQLFHKKWPEGVLSLASAAVLVHRGASGTCPLYKAMGVSTREDPLQQGVRVEEEVVVENTSAELYQYCRKLENLPQMIRHLKSVTSLESKKSHWVAEAATGVNVSWDMEIVLDEENRFIEWKTPEGSHLQAVASLKFEDLADETSTRVKVKLEYVYSVQDTTLALSKFFARDIKSELLDDLEIFKHYMESGAFPWDEEKSPTRGITLQTH